MQGRVTAKTFSEEKTVATEKIAVKKEKNLGPAKGSHHYLI